MPRFRLPEISDLIASKRSGENLMEWTKKFCSKMAWSTRPLALEDDLFQACYIYYMRVFAFYHDRPLDERIKIYKCACYNEARDLAAKNTLRKMPSTDAEEFVESCRTAPGGSRWSNIDQMLGDLRTFLQSRLSSKRESLFSVDDVTKAVYRKLNGFKLNSEEREAIDMVASRIGFDQFKGFVLGETSHV